MCSVQCAVYSVQCTVCSVKFAVYSVQCIVCSVQCVVYSVQCTACSLQCTVYSVQSTVCSVKRAVYSLQCTVSSVQCTGYHGKCGDRGSLPDTKCPNGETCSIAKTQAFSVRKSRPFVISNSETGLCYKFSLLSNFQWQ